MVVSQEDSEIRRHFQERCRLPVKITFVVQPERLGMANALSLAAADSRPVYPLCVR